MSLETDRDTHHIELALADSTAPPTEPGYRPGAPNVVVIVLDDLGFAQLGCFGSDLDTPNLDRLADRGLRFTNFHTTAVCSPTRACLLTGRNHHRVGMGMLPDLPVNYPGTPGSSLRRPGRSPRSCWTRAGRRPRSASGTSCHATSGQPGPFAHVADGSRVRALLRLPQRRDEPVDAEPDPRPATRGASGHSRGGLPPRGRPGRRGASDSSETCESTTRPDRSCSGTQQEPLMLLTRRPRSGSTATRAGSTRGGTCGAPRRSPARRSSASSLPMRSCRNGPTGSRHGTASMLTGKRLYPG